MWWSNDLIKDNNKKQIKEKIPTRIIIKINNLKKKKKNI